MTSQKTGDRTVAVLLSDKRSGSTILQSELCKHLSVQHVTYSPHTYFETQHWLQSARLLKMPRQTFYGHTYPASLKSIGAARNYLRDCLQRNLPEATLPAEDRGLVFDGWEMLCQRFAQPVFFEKSPQHLAQWGALSLLLEWMQSTSFQTRIIALVRNPLAVMYSSDLLFATNPKVRQFGWADMYRNLLAFQALLPQGQISVIRYEDLIAAPTQVMATICDFIGIPTDPSIGAEVHVHSREKWRDDPEYDLQLHESVKQVARRFGYTDDDLHNPDKPGISAAKQMRQGMESQYRKLRSRMINGVARPWLLRWRTKR